VDRVGRFIRMIFTLIGNSFLSSIDHVLYLGLDAPIELVVGTIFLYKLLGMFHSHVPCSRAYCRLFSTSGVSCFFGLAVAVMCLPLNHFAGKIIVGTYAELRLAQTGT
jgi:hypothetical protein